MLLQRLVISSVLATTALAIAVDGFSSFPSTQQTLAYHVEKARPKQPPGAPPARTPKSIYDTIQGDSEFSKLSKALNISNEIVSILNDSSASVTFFAVPDWALRRRKRHGKRASLSLLDFVDEDELHTWELSDVVELLEASDNVDVVGGDNHVGDDGDDDDDKKQRRKEIIRKIVQAVLEYHILPNALNSNEIASNNTLPTNLTFSKLVGGQPQRVKIEHTLYPPVTKLNMYSNIVKADVNATNGLIHVINHPLLPPLPAFQGLFLLPSFFSFATTTIQRTDLTGGIDFRYSRENKKFVGSSAVTAFVPSNRAFQRLPTKLKLFLFSPFGERVLGKLLSLHVAPDLVLFSDYLYNTTSDLEGFADSQRLDALPSSFGASLISQEELLGWAQIPRPFGETDNVGREDSIVQSLFRSEFLQLDAAPLTHHPRLISAYNVTVPTLLKNYSLDVVVAKYEVDFPLPLPHRPSQIVTKVYVNGQVVVSTDIPGANGAIHVLGRVINPHRRSSDRADTDGLDGEDQDDDWEDWEEWLPQWGQE